MKKNRLRAMVLFMTVLVLNSCSYRLLDFALISSKTVDLSKGATFVRGKNKAEGKDLVHWIIIIPTGTLSIKDALDRAIESTPGCVALMDGVIHTKLWWIPYIYGQQSATVEGTPLIDPSLSYNPSKIPSYGKIELNKKGEIKGVDSISRVDYYVLKDKIVRQSKVTEFKNSSEAD